MGEVESRRSNKWLAPAQGGASARPSWCRLAAIGTATLLIGNIALATDVYETIGASGVPHYSNRRVDDSSQLIEKYSSQSIDQTVQKTQPNAPAARISKRNDRAAYKKIFVDASTQYNVPHTLALAVAEVESAYKSNALSNKGAMGIMQLTPATMARYGVTDPFDATQNITAGIRHLGSLLELYHGNVTLTLAAYNAGEGAVRRNGNRIPPYNETMLYVPSVLAKAEGFSQGSEGK